MEIPLFWSTDYSSLHRGGHHLLKTSLGILPIGQNSNDSVKSPGKATFGGFWSENPNLPQDWNEAKIQIRNEYSNATVLSINFPPSYFHPEIFSPQVSFFRRNARSMVDEVNFHIDITSHRRVSHGNRKKERQFKEMGGVIFVADREYWSKAYSLLKDNRARRGLEFSMTWEIFERNLMVLPEVFTVWGARLNDELIGAALTVKIDSDVLYVLYWGDSLIGRQYSVVASLCSELVDFCRSSDFVKLDLGISSVQGILDTNLARFKANLGACETLKSTISVSLT